MENAADIPSVASVAVPTAEKKRAPLRCFYGFHSEAWHSIVIRSNHGVSLANSKILREAGNSMLKEDRTCHCSGSTMSDWLTLSD